MKRIWNRTLVVLSVAGVATSGGCIETDDRVLDCDDLTADLRLADRSDPEDDTDDDDADHILNCDWFVAGDAVIDPGVILEVRDGFTIHVEGGASLSARGTAEAPIVIRGATAARGAWGGIYIDSDNPETALDQVTIAHGGGVAVTSNAYEGSVILLGGGHLSMTNTTLREGATTGLHVDGQAALTFSNNTITAHDGQPIVVAAEHIVDLDGASALDGNGSDVVRILTPGTGGVSGTWPKLTVPWLVDPNVGDLLSIELGSQVEIEAGAELHFRDNTGLVIDGAESTIAARGTAEAPVSFVGVTDGVGTWRGVNIRSSNVDNLIDHAIIDGGGSEGFNSNDDRGGIVIDPEAALTLSNTTIRNTPNCGVSTVYSNGVFTDGGGNAFENVQTDICLPPAE